MTHSTLKKLAAAGAAAIGLSLASSGAHAAIAFAPFILQSDLNTVMGQSNTIGITYAGNKFVGSVYFGGNNLQLYQSDLNGGNVSKFGTAPLPNGGGETVLAASLGQAGFGVGDIYASGANGNIYKYANAGGAPSLFGSLLSADGAARQIFFDPGSTFGGKLLVSTNSGHIVSFSSAGVRTLIASVGEDAEGMDIASSVYGPYAGQLLVASEGSGSVRAISPGGVISLLISGVSVVETISTVPLNLGASGNPVEGFYVANYPIDVQKAPVSSFTGLNGYAILLGEQGVNSQVNQLMYDAGTGLFSVNLIGNLPNQGEDGIFVTADRIIQTHVPEPGMFGLAALGLGALALAGRRRKSV